MRERLVGSTLWLCVALCACVDDSSATGRDGGADDSGTPDAGTGGEPTPEVHAVVEPFPFTHVLSEDAAALLSMVDNDGMLLIFEGASAELDALSQDTILVVPAGPGAPLGLLRRIDVLTRDGDRVVLQTRAASILHAFRKVDISVTAGGPGDMLPTLPTALSVESSGKYPFSHDVDWVVFDGDEDPDTTEDRVLVSGKMQATVGYDFQLSFDWGALQDILDCLDDPNISCIEALNPLKYASDIGLKLRFVSDLSAGADLTVSGAAALSFKKEIPLAPPISLGVIPAGPIMLTPRLAASAGIGGGATAKLDVDVAVSGGVEFGLQVSGTSVWPVGKGPYLDDPSGSATIQNTAQVRAWLNPRVEMLIYDVVGPTIGLEPYAEVTADTDSDPCWRLEGGLDATLGIHLGVGPVTLISESRSVPIVSKEFANGECPLPGGPGGGSLDPTFEPWAAAVSEPLYSGGSIDDSTAIAPTHDGRFLFTATTATGLLKFGDDGTPLWIRRYSHDQAETLYAARAVSLLDTSLLVLGRRGSVLRTDPTGVLLDAHILDIADDSNTHIGAIARTDDGGAWAAGDSPQPGGDADGWLARFAPDGTLVDAFAIRGPYSEWPKSVVPLADGGVLVTGQTFDAGSTRSWAARLAADGSVAWFVRLIDCAPEGGLGEDDIAVRAATLTHDGNFALAGYTFYPRYHGMLVKLRQEDGSLAWGQTYAGAMGLGLQWDAVAALESGGFLVGGTQVSIGANDAIALAETDSAGNVAWMQRYDTPGRDGHVSLWRTPADNGVIVGATTQGLVEGVASALLLKVPRKDGALVFDSASGATVESVSVTDAGVCLDTEPYADGSIEPVAATLEPLPLVEDEALPPERLAL